MTIPYFIYNYAPDTRILRSGIIVEKLSEYLTYKSLYNGAKKSEDIPDFQERVVPEISLELSVSSYPISLAAPLTLSIAG